MPDARLQRTREAYCEHVEIVSVNDLGLCVSCGRIAPTLPKDIPPRPLPFTKEA